MEYKAGDLSGFVRFESPEAAIKITNKAKAAPAALKVLSFPITVQVLEGETGLQWLR